MRADSILPLVLILATVMPASGANQAVSGRVLDSDDSPIDGISIQSYRDHRALGPPVISKAGEYRIEFPDGKPLDSVRYDHSDWYPAVVEDISGKNSHTIHKTLYRRSEKLSFVGMLQVISDLERLAELDKLNEQLKQNAERFRYKAMFDEILKLSLPQDLQNRIKLIMQKYGM
jgi:hypothetical protein